MKAVFFSSQETPARERQKEFTSLKIPPSVEVKLVSKSSLQGFVLIILTRLCTGFSLCCWWKCEGRGEGKEFWLSPAEQGSCLERDLIVASESVINSVHQQKE